MTARASILLLVAVAVLSVGASARAQDAGLPDLGPSDAGPSDAGPSDAGPSDAGPSDSGPGSQSGPSESDPPQNGAPLERSEAPAQDAQALFRDSVVAYREGDFEEAARLLRAAYSIEPAPVLQYNLARALEGTGDLEGAIGAYEAYVEGEPDAQDRGAIEARLVTLREQLGEQQALAAVRAHATLEVDEATSSSDAPEATPSAAGWIVLGGGVAGLAVGLALGVHAQSLNEVAPLEPTHARTVERVAEAESFALAANVTLGISAAVAVAGLVYGIVDVVTLDSGRAEVRVGLTPRGVVLRGAF